MHFFQLHDPIDHWLGLVALDADRSRFYRYVPTTGLWHHDHTIGAAITGVELDPIHDRSTIGALMSKCPRLDERHEDQKARSAAYRTQITELAEVFTSAELGLTMHELGRNRPITTPGLPALLVTRGQHWSILSRYGPESAWSASALDP